MRIKILNALAMSRPVVSTTLGSEGIPVVSGESIEIGDSPQQFAISCVRLLTDAPRAQAIAAAGRRLAEDWYSLPGG